MASAIVLFIIFVPLFIWSYLRPEDSLLWGKRWQYQENPVVSGEAIRIVKTVSIIGIVVFSFILVMNIFFLF